MNLFYKLVVACFFFVFLNSCLKVAPIPTQLQIQVLDEDGYIVPNATVYLFANEYDFFQNKDVLQTTTTDPNGYFYFTNLSPTTYYYYVQSGCLNNFNTTYYLSQPLLPNQLNQYSPVYLAVSETVRTKNISNNPFAIYIDGSLAYTSQPGGTTVDFPEISGGNHIVRVLQLSGYAYHPIDQVFTVNVSCGVSPTITYPQ